MKEGCENRQVQEEVLRAVVEAVTGQRFGTTKVNVTPLITNYFSFVFSIQIHGPNSVEKVFVKIPKKDLRRGPKTILPISPADRIMAEDEVSSLRFLLDEWTADDLGVLWVRLRAFLPQYNAIVTDAVDATDALGIFRRRDLCSRMGSKASRVRVRAAMARIGEAFGRFHKRSAQSGVFRMRESLHKLESYCDELSIKTRNEWAELIKRVLRSMADLEIPAVEVPTLKGIDIRNVLMNERERIFFLDPGRVKRSCREADLARFLMTYRILYWGSRMFLLQLRPDTEAEKAFLKIYYSNTAPGDSRLLSLYLIKEQLKHWHTAIDSLYLLPWSMAVKRLVAAIYINPYYTRQLAAEVKKVF